MADYIVKRGDSLWKIASNFGSRIAGNTITAKINTLVAVNGIKNQNLIYVGQEINFAAGGSTSSASAPAATATPPNKAVLTGFGLQASSETGRDAYACWTWHKRWENFKHYKIRWEWYVNGHVEYEESEITQEYSNKSIPEDSPWVQIFILPIAENRLDKDGKDTGVPHWTADGWTSQQYQFFNNPPKKPDVPVCEIDDTTLTMKIDRIENEVAASWIVFQVVKDNSSAVYLSPWVPVVPVVDPVTTKTIYSKVTHQYTVQLGSNYTVRAKAVGANYKESGWTDFSEEVGSKPSAPAMIKDSCRRVKREDQTQAAHLEWTAIPNATKYKVEYANIKSDFDNGSGTVKEKTTDDNRTSIDIVFQDSEVGKDYYFRVRAINEDIQDQDEQMSDPSDPVLIPIGSVPAPPTTWSSSESAFVGDVMELNWIHNPTDNSKQTFAQLSFNINDSGWLDMEVFENTTDANTTGERVDETKYTYGTAVSYKGSMYFKMDTNHPDLKNAKVIWRAKTAGITDEFSKNEWSTERTIYIYEKPTLSLSMTSDLEGSGAIIETLTAFPCYIRGQLSLTDYKIQRPVGYHLQILANDYYTTVDNVGRTKTINPGDAVYSKYFDTSDTLIVEISANNIDLESGISYTVLCSADMSTGLTVSNQHEFTVSWVDVEYAINADVIVDANSYAALITPYCREKISTTVGEGDDAYTTYEEGALVENITLSVYRREYDGSYKEIASGIPNDSVSVTDPHPALDYARYRFTARDNNTGALSFWDMPGRPVNCSAVILQWAEEWSTFETGAETNIEGPSWSGSLLRLPYNIKVSDKRKRDVTMVEYAGREHPVTYYGTQVGETSTWTMDIPADDKETIYALRRLSLWAGDVYVREPSGMGFWANVEVSFDQTYKEVKVPVTLSITRVEGGV